MSEIQVTEPRRGRPRIAGVDERILDVTLELLARVGYDAMSIAAVAAEAGVTKPTLYRRWESKEDLVTSAVSTLAATGPVASTSNVWDDLVGELESFHRAISRPEGMALVGNVLALEHRHPTLIELYRRKVASVRRSRIRSVLLQAQQLGAVAADADVETVINMMIGYYYSARVGGTPIDAEWPRRCVQLVRASIEDKRQT
ncbi:TetR/AcrR family transcriptional regulator (plasmid) [Rhodococcus globerulus]|uniref:TetR/AcrR family transcriptional regulator n=1 Tax=Rhodococcus globerulus TaxID=33008 RepID=UPI0039EBCA86